MKLLHKQFGEMSQLLCPEELLLVTLFHCFRISSSSLNIIIVMWCGVVVM